MQEANDDETRQKELEKEVEEDEEEEEERGNTREDMIEEEREEKDEMVEEEDQDEDFSGLEKVDNDSDKERDNESGEVKAFDEAFSAKDAMETVPGAEDPEVVEPASLDIALENADDSANNVEMNVLASVETVQTADVTHTVASLREMYKEQFGHSARGRYAKNRKWLRKRLGLVAEREVHASSRELERRCSEGMQEDQEKEMATNMEEDHAEENAEDDQDFTEGEATEKDDADEDDNLMEVDDATTSAEIGGSASAEAAQQADTLSTVATLKKMYKKRFRRCARGRYCSDEGWLRDKLGLVAQQGLRASLKESEWQGSVYKDVDKDEKIEEEDVPEEQVQENYDLQEAEDHVEEKKNDLEGEEDDGEASRAGDIVPAEKDSGDNELDLISAETDAMNIVASAKEPEIVNDASSDRGLADVDTAETIGSALLQTEEPPVDSPLTVTVMRDMYKKRFGYFARGRYGRDAEWLRKKLGIAEAGSPEVFNEGVAVEVPTGADAETIVSPVLPAAPAAPAAPAVPAAPAAPAAAAVAPACAENEEELKGSNGEEEEKKEGGDEISVVTVAQEVVDVMSTTESTAATVSATPAVTWNDGADGAEDAVVDRAVPAETSESENHILTVAMLKGMYKDRFDRPALGRYCNDAAWLRQKLGLAESGANLQHSGRGGVVPAVAEANVHSAPVAAAVEEKNKFTQVVSDAQDSATPEDATFCSNLKDRDREIAALPEVDGEGHFEAVARADFEYYMDAAYAILPEEYD
jgi:hypothetical protein